MTDLPASLMFLLFWFFKNRETGSVKYMSIDSHLKLTEPHYKTDIITGLVLFNVVLEEFLQCHSDAFRSVAVFSGMLKSANIICGVNSDVSSWYVSMSVFSDMCYWAKKETNINLCITQPAPVHADYIENSLLNSMYKWYALWIFRQF